MLPPTSRRKFEGLGRYLLVDVSARRSFERCIVLTSGFLVPQVRANALGWRVPPRHQGTPCPTNHLAATGAFKESPGSTLWLCPSQSRLAKKQNLEQELLCNLALRYISGEPRCTDTELDPAQPRGGARLPLSMIFGEGIWCSLSQSLKKARAFVDSFVCSFIHLFVRSIWPTRIACRLGPE